MNDPLPFLKLEACAITPDNQVRARLRFAFPGAKEWSVTIPLTERKKTWMEEEREDGNGIC